MLISICVGMFPLANSALGCCSRGPKFTVYNKYKPSGM